ncbi:MAG: SMC-Scp complex subunit ScpB [Acinetobacter sp.]|nr:SMC-Scp complex subunit ScpB [Acinetobacter sp.]
MATSHSSSNQNLTADELQHILLQIEAIIFASDSPVSIARLKQAFGQRFSSTQLRQFMQQVAILQHGRSIELLETAQGFRFQVREKYRQAIVQFNPERPMKLSNSLLEVLAIIAYHQPVTRSEIEQIRGVSNNAQTLRHLFKLNWIKESGFREVPGRPALLVTTPQFLNAFGVSSLSQLPPLAEKVEFKTAFETVDDPLTSIKS